MVGVTGGVDIAGDDRARVPFALVAVILLVGAATYAADLRGRDRGVDDPDVSAAVERTTATTRTVVADAVSRAARDAALDPVVVPANTTYGRAISAKTPFRDSLRVRIYLEVRESLPLVDERVGDVTASSRLPPVENASALRAAKERVELNATNGTLDVRIQNLTVAANRSGRRVYEGDRTVSVAVDSPAVVLHDRSVRFQTRLDNGTVEGPGLSRRLTAAMYAIAWLRGYAYYTDGRYRLGGPDAPESNVLENVVANRHIEFATNYALLAQQRAAFGREDRQGRAALHRAAFYLLLFDLLGSAFRSQFLNATTADTGRLTDLLERPDPTKPMVPSAPFREDRPSPEDQMTVGINETADRAFADLFGGPTAQEAASGEPLSLPAVVNATYAADARVLTRVTPVVSESRPSINYPNGPPDDGSGWTLVHTSESTAATVTNSSAPLPVVPEGWEPHRNYSRRVIRTHTVFWDWTAVNGSETLTTHDSWKEVDRIGLRVVDDHAPSDVAPDNPIARVHRPGGPLDGQNLVGVPDEATQVSVSRRGGPDAVATRVAKGTAETSPVHLRRDPPDGLRRWVYRDVADVHDRVRNYSVRIERGEVVTANPAQRLADRVRENRTTLLDAPRTYPSVADKVRVAARGAYVDRVVALLDRRANATREHRTGVDDAVGEATDGSFSLSDVVAGMEHRRDVSTHRIGALDAGGRPGPTPVAVDASPAYLPTSAVDADRLTAVDSGEFRTLSVKNTNVFTIPYGEASDATYGAVSAAAETTGRMGGFATGARLLATANRSVSTAGDSDVGVHHENLRSSVDAGVGVTREALDDTLASETNLSTREREAALDEAFDEWSTTHGRALAVLNESVVDRLVIAAAERQRISVWRQELLDVRLRAAVVRAMADERTRSNATAASGVTARLRNIGADEVNRIAKERVSEAVSAGIDRKINQTLTEAKERLPKRYSKRFPKLQTGLPLVPPFYGWYATVNVWYVRVNGTYPSLTLRARRGAPDGSGATVVYRRDGGSVDVDVDGDGRPDRLGWSTRLHFDVETAVLVVVPPGYPGVGDANGQWEEHTEGFPATGSTRVRSTGTNGTGGDRADPNANRSVRRPSV